MPDDWGEWGDGLPIGPAPDDGGEWGDGKPLGPPGGGGPVPPVTDPVLLLTPAILNVSRVAGLEYVDYEEVAITNSGGGTLDKAFVSESVDWLDAWAEGSGNTQTIRVRVFSELLAAGVYSAEVTITASNATNSPQTLYVYLTVTDSATPTAPYSGLIIWVATTGSDSTGNGAQGTPYRTIERALLDFTDGSQIRLLDGVYTPVSTVTVSGMAGSIFSETPGGATIRPLNATVHNSAIVVMDSDRFTVQGVNIIQSTASGHMVGIYAADVTNFIANTCSVADFDSPSGFNGILASGSGKIENCTIEDIQITHGDSYCIRSTGIHVIDCTVRRVVNSGGGASVGIDVSDS